MPLTGSRLLELVKQIGQRLERQQIPYALSGAIANLLWGVPRATKDIDLLLTVPRIRLPEVWELLCSLGCQGNLQQALQESLEQHCLRLSFEGVVIEVFLPYLPYHHEVLRRRVRREINGVPLWFVTAEDLVLLKLLFHRTKDIADIKAILATQKGSLDLQYLQDALEGLLPRDDARRAELAGWVEQLAR